MAKDLFIIANIQMKLGSQRLNYDRVQVSQKGIPYVDMIHAGLPIKLGDKLDLRICPMKSPISFNIAGTVIVERNKDATSFGFKFSSIGSKDHELLIESLKKFGGQPKGYVRKYPRIPSTGQFQNMPVKATVFFDDNDPCEMKICNVSLGGVLLACNNPISAFLEPTSKINVSLELEPHQSPNKLRNSIKFSAEVIRIIEELGETYQVMRYFGVRFSRFDEQNKQLFLDTVKRVLLEIKDSK